jgi:hypothetical protein
MKSGLDEYTRNARLKPAFLVALPIALTVAVLGFKQSATEGTLFGLASSLGFTFLLSQLVRDRGKAREPWLFKRWNGKPTTAMLRHGDTCLNVHTRARYHKRLSAMLPEISLPTAELEKANSAEADATYASCGDYLLSKTRDKERFQLLFQENVNYGFRRNLWAMKTCWDSHQHSQSRCPRACYSDRGAGRCRAVVCESDGDCDCRPVADVVAGSHHAELGEDRCRRLRPTAPWEH